MGKMGDQGGSLEEVMSELSPFNAGNGQARIYEVDEGFRYP